MRWSGLIKDDSAYLRHILDEIDFLEESRKGIEFRDLLENAEKQRAWLRSLEVIGEATKNLSFEFVKSILRSNGEKWRASETG